MKIQFRMEGGVALFPGLARPVEIDSEALPPADRADLEARLAEARFFECPAPPMPTKARDHQTYEITAEGGGRRRTLRVADPVPVELQRLVQRLREIAREHASTPGP